MERQLKNTLLQNKLVGQFLRPIKYIKDVAVGAYVFYKYGTTPPEKPAKSVFLDIKDNVYNRYFYLFLKFFALEGYTVYLKANPVTLRYVYHFRQSRLILQEKIAHLVIGRKKDCQIYISDTRQPNQLSADYFTQLLRGDPDPRDYYVPMAMHPLMYHKGWWNQPIAASPRLKSIFFAGNFDRSHYDLPAAEDVFNMINRIRIHDLLQEKAPTYFPRSLDDLENRTAQEEVVIVVKKQFLVPMEKLRPTLARYSFFLACPGYIMPFSHNVIEAMSVGTVPLIQACYARLFQPALQHGKNAILFDDEADLLVQIEKAFSLTPDTIAYLTENVLAYYREQLTPQSVVQRIQEGTFRHIFLNAELPSVNLVNRNNKLKALSQDEVPI